MKEIKIVIGKDGKTNIDVAGVKGGACKDLTKAIEKALGSVETSKKTEEFYSEDATVSNKQTTGY